MSVLKASCGAVLAASNIRVSSGNRASPTQGASPALRARPSVKAAFFSKRGAVAARRAVVSVSAVTAPAFGTKADYKCPNWSAFEFGSSPVLWEPATPKAGEIMTVWFNPDLTDIEDKGNIAFNGGFNGPFMCGGAPRPMASKSRGSAASPLYSVRIKVPKAASFLEFGFTDGQNWDEGYKVIVQPLKENKGRDVDWMSRMLTIELDVTGACDEAFFPDPAPVPLSCNMPGGMGLVGQSCELDVVAGCTDPDAPNYDPMATIDSGSCDLPAPSKSK